MNGQVSRNMDIKKTLILLQKVIGGICGILCKRFVDGFTTKLQIFLLYRTFLAIDSMRKSNGKGKELYELPRRLSLHYIIILHD